jgi:hypothetical protein
MTSTRGSGVAVRRGVLASALASLGLAFSFAFLPGAGGGCSSSQSDCRGDLASFSNLCVATFDGTEANLPMCPAEAVSQQISRCGDLNVIRYASLGGFDCVYDSATHKLVGAESGTDVPTSCPGGFTSIAGRLPDYSCFSKPGSSVPCSSDPSADGGAD